MSSFYEEWYKNNEIKVYESCKVTEYMCENVAIHSIKKTTLRNVTTF